MNAAPRTIRSRVLPAVAGAAMVALLGAGAWYGYDYATSQPIRHVLFVGDAGRIARADLEAFARSIQGVASNGASLAEVREAARRIPWVRDAAVRRRFPDAIEVSFETFVPLARWKDGGLVSARGELFNAEHAGFLPLFDGRPGAAPRMATEYLAIAKALAPLAAAVVELRLSARGGWQVVLDSGLAIELGREDILPRLERFVAAWPRIPDGGAGARRADLRYANGFAMQRAEEKVKR